MKMSPSCIHISKTVRISRLLPAQSHPCRCYPRVSFSNFRSLKVLEYCDGGDLDDKLKEQGQGASRREPKRRRGSELQLLSGWQLREAEAGAWTRPAALSALRDARSTTRAPRHALRRARRRLGKMLTLRQICAAIAHLHARGICCSDGVCKGS